VLELKKKIEDKEHVYNIITDQTQKTNKAYDESKLNNLFLNANKVLFSSKNSLINVNEHETLNNKEIGRDTERMELYTEKVTIWEKGILKDILVTIYQFQMSFIFPEKDLFFMRPINILTDIDSFTKSTMMKSYEKEGSKPKPGWQTLCFKVRPSVVKTQGRKHSHVIFVQHQNSATDGNYEKLIDFINWQRMKYAKNYVEVKQNSPVPVNNYFEITQYNIKSEFKFDMVKFTDRNIGATIEKRRISTLIG